MTISNEIKLIIEKTRIYFKATFRALVAVCAICLSGLTAYGFWLAFDCRSSSSCTQEMGDRDLDPPADLPVNPNNFP